MADHRVAGRLGAVLRSGEGGHVRHEEEGDGADPVGPVALVSGHDEGGAGADRTERPDHERVDVLLGEKKAGSVVEAVPEIVTGMGAVPPDPDIGVGDEAIERDPLERALENSLHDETEGSEAARSAMGRPISRGRTPAGDPVDHPLPLLASATRKRDAGGSVCGLHERIMADPARPAKTPPALHPFRRRPVTGRRSAGAGSTHGRSKTNGDGQGGGLVRPREAGKAGKARTNRLRWGWKWNRERKSVQPPIQTLMSANWHC